MNKWSQHTDIYKDYYYLASISWVLIFISFFINSTILLVIGSGYFFFFIANYMYLNWVGKRLEVDFPEERVKTFTGEEGVIKVRIRQPSLLPIFFGKLTITTDKNINFKDSVELRYSNELDIPFHVYGRNELILEVPFQSIKRGVAKIHKVQIEVDHFIGFGKVILNLLNNRKYEVIVYPEKKVVSGVERMVPKNEGTYPTRSSFYEDKNTIIGTRNYESGDSFNKIHWKATARLSSLQTKVHERASQFTWLFVLDIRSSNLEDRIKGISYLLQYATKYNISFGLLVNIKKFGNPSYYVLPFGEGKRQLQTALEFLARVDKNCVVINSLSFTRIVSNYVSPYVILCMDEEETEKYSIRKSSQCYVLDVSREDAVLTLKKVGSSRSRRVRYG
ncbi:DUF58 domain-containing protein [Sutcliffiella cohnii]